MSETNSRAEILRAAGHHDAADLLDAIDKAGAMRTVDEVEQPRPAPEPQRQPTDLEAQQRAEAAYMLAALKRDLPDVVRRSED